MHLFFIYIVCVVALIHSSGCSKLLPDKVRSSMKGDTFLSAVAKCCPNLTEINVSDCAGVTDAGLAKLMKFCKILDTG